MIKRVALQWLITAGILASAVHGVYLATHTHVRTYNGGATVSVAAWSLAAYHGENTGLVVGAPNGTCAGVEYWQEPPDGITSIDMYAYRNGC